MESGLKQSAEAAGLGPRVANSPQWLFEPKLKKFDSRAQSFWEDHARRGVRFHQCGLPGASHPSSSFFFFLIFKLKNFFWPHRAHSSVLAWRIPGTGEPGGLLSVGSHRVGHN